MGAIHLYIFIKRAVFILQDCTKIYLVITFYELNLHSMRTKQFFTGFYFYFFFTKKMKPGLL